MRLTSLFVLASILGLTACGGGGDTAPDLEGVWAGNYSFGAQGEHLTGMIKNGGPAFFYQSDGVLFVMPHTPSGSQLDEPVVTYPTYGFIFNGGQTTLASWLKGDASSSQISGTLTVAGGLANLVVRPITPLKGTASLVPGIWSGLYIGSQNVALNVSSSGAIAGTDTYGCQYTGQIDQLKSGENLFSVALHNAGPGPICGHVFDGLAYESDTDQTGAYGNAAGTYYYVAAYDPTEAVVMELKVQ
ncbi:MAG TPA: hypothetical protein VLV87_03360 [Gammaproteobacteria bacterium]|nr:hypothetical protein [Gammaproteobacteria bacterium]